MTRSLRWVCALLLGSATAACSANTTMPDAQIRAPGERLHDGGFGLGSGGFTDPPAETSTGTSVTTTETCEARGFGLGSGGKEDPCVTSPTL